jgi:hypothetical protein
MRSASPPSNPPAHQAARPAGGASTLRVVADREAGPRTALSPFERVLAALTYRETGAAFLPDAREAAPSSRKPR